MSKAKYLIPTILLIIFEAAVGTLILIDGERFAQIIFIVFGVVMFVCGVVALIRSLVSGRNGGSINGGALAVSLLMIAIGGFFAAASGSVVGIFTAMTLVFGIILIVDGIFKLTEYLTFRSMGPIGFFGIFSSILSIILGIILAFNPFGSTVVMWTVTGIMLIATAIVDLISLIVYAVALKNVDSKTAEK